MLNRSLMWLQTSQFENNDSRHVVLLRKGSNERFPSILPTHNRSGFGMVLQPRHKCFRWTSKMVGEAFSREASRVLRNLPLLFELSTSERTVSRKNCFNQTM